jgi:hypothetical protein
MTATVTKAGPYYSTGSISFSSLRSNFKETSSGAISASELKRNTSISNTNPIVPDCTENRTSGPLSNGISTGNDLKLSQFRNSIKYYYITQTGTDLNFDIDAQSWNNNLNKTIKKWMYINGTCGTNSTSSFASTFDATAYNLTIDVSGEIYGAGGEGGTLNNLSGTSGGSALSVENLNGSNITINVQSSAKIYGGGGGGEKGAYGSIGDSGTCWNYDTKSVGSGCNSCGDCGSGWERYGGCDNVGGCNCGGWWLWAGCSGTVYSSAECRQPKYYTVTGGAGGEGGNGGRGQGYNYNKTNGSIGSIGLTGSCATYIGTGTLPGTGYTGETGGNGGDWGQPGTNTNSSSNGSPAGRAITGSNYSVIGEINSSTVKGLYKSS